MYSNKRFEKKPFRNMNLRFSNTTFRLVIVVVAITVFLGLVFWLSPTTIAEMK